MHELSRNRQPNFLRTQRHRFPSPRRVPRLYGTAPQNTEHQQNQAHNELLRYDPPLRLGDDAPGDLCEERRRRRTGARRRTADDGRLRGAGFARRRQIPRRNGLEKLRHHAPPLRQRDAALRAALPREHLPEPLRLLRFQLHEQDPPRDPHPGRDSRRSPGDQARPVPAHPARDGRGAAQFERTIPGRFDEDHAAVLRADFDRGAAARHRRIPPAERLRPARSLRLPGDLQPRPLPGLPPARQEDELPLPPRDARPPLRSGRAQGGPWGT